MSGVFFAATTQKRFLQWRHWTGFSGVDPRRFCWGTRKGHVVPVRIAQGGIAEGREELEVSNSRHTRPLIIIQDFCTCAHRPGIPTMGFIGPGRSGSSWSWIPRNARPLPCWALLECANVTNSIGIATTSQQLRAVQNSAEICQLWKTGGRILPNPRQEMRIACAVEIEENSLRILGLDDQSPRILFAGVENHARPGRVQDRTLRNRNGSLLCRLPCSIPR
jgi:hypothetical protein